MIHKNCQSQSQVKSKIVTETHIEKLCQTQPIAKNDLGVIVNKVDISTDCQTQPKVETTVVNKAHKDICQAKLQNKLSLKGNNSEPSELELMFKKIKDKKQLNLDRHSPKDKINKTIKMSQNTTMSQKKLKLEEPLSIKKLLKHNQNNIPIRKLESGKVRKLILELENPTKNQSSRSGSKIESDKKKRILKKKDSVLPNQARITKFFQKENESDDA